MSEPNWLLDGSRTCSIIIHLPTTSSACFCLGLHPPSVKLRTTHHYAEFCRSLQTWLDKISDPDAQRQMVDEYTHCIHYVYRRMKAATHSRFVDGRSFFETAMEYYGRVKTVILWQYEKDKAHQTKHRPTTAIKAHQSYL